MKASIYIYIYIYILVHERPNMHCFFYSKDLSKIPYELLLDVINKMTLKPSKDSDQSGHIPVSIENV